MDLLEEFGIGTMPVHITNPTEVAYAHSHKCQSRPTFHTYMLTPAAGGATPVEGLNYIKIATYAPNRKRVTIMVSAQLGNSQFGQAVICHSMNTATSAAGLQGATAPGSDIPGFVMWGSRNGISPLILESQSELWAACPTDAAAGGILVSIAEEIEED